MGCRCKHNIEPIEDGKEVIASLRELFIKRMTVDSDHCDRRRKDFNQAIFHVDDECNRIYPAWGIITMDMILQCFDDAAKDWRKTWCDVDNCTRK